MRKDLYTLYRWLDLKPETDNEFALPANLTSQMSHQKFCTVFPFSF